MNDSRFETLRSKYRSEWDARQVIADRNLRLTQEGKKPSKEELVSEQKAAAAVEHARDDLLEAMSHG